MFCNCVLFGTAVCTRFFFWRFARVFAVFQRFSGSVLSQLQFLQSFVSCFLVFSCCFLFCFIFVFVQYASNCSFSHVFVIELCLELQVLLSCLELHSVLGFVLVFCFAVYPRFCMCVLHTTVLGFVPRVLFAVYPRFCMCVLHTTVLGFALVFYSPFIQGFVCAFCIQLCSVLSSCFVRRLSKVFVCAFCIQLCSVLSSCFVRRFCEQLHLV